MKRRFGAIVLCVLVLGLFFALPTAAIAKKKPRYTKLEKKLMKQNSAYKAQIASMNGYIVALQNDNAAKGASIAALQQDNAADHTVVWNEYFYIENLEYAMSVVNDYDGPHATATYRRPDGTYDYCAGNQLGWQFGYPFTSFTDSNPADFYDGVPDFEFFPVADPGWVSPSSGSMSMPVPAPAAELEPRAPTAPAAPGARSRSGSAYIAPYTK